jgi:hypothetical protein
MNKPFIPHRLLLPDGATPHITDLSPGDQLQVHCERTQTWLPQQPILGYALTPDGLCLYLPGTMPSAFRTSADYVFGFVQEEWFGPVPDTLAEILLSEYAFGHVLLYRAAGQQQLPFMRAA